MIELITNYKKNIAETLKILTLENIRPFFLKKYYVKIVIGLILSFGNAIAKIVAPAAFGRGLEMLARQETSTSMGVLTLNAPAMFTISIVLTAWNKADSTIKQLLLKEIESLIIKTNTLALIKKAHKISFQEHLTLRADLTKKLLEIFNYQGKYPTEGVSHLFQAIFDITLGIGLIWHHFGKYIALEFALYTLVDIVILQRVINYCFKIHDKLHRVNDCMSEFMNREHEVLAFEETVRLFGHEKFENYRSQKKLDKYLFAHLLNCNAENRTALIKYLPLLFANVTILTYVFSKPITLNVIDELVFLLTYTSLFAENLTNLSTALKTCRQAMQSFKELRNFLNGGEQLTKISYVQLVRQPGLWDIFSTSPKISFENVFFSYPNTQKIHLKNLNFTIQPGKKIGVMGHSSAGKSTMMRLLLGLCYPTMGAVKINGYDTRDIPKKVLKKLFCYIPQAPELFMRETLAYNFIYGQPNESVLKKYLVKRKLEKKLEHEQRNYSQYKEEDDDIDRILKQCDQDLKEVGLAHLHTVKTAKNSLFQLSGGEKQRVCVLRALLKNSSIFVFDEITSSLDAKTEERLLRHLDKTTSGKTKISISHRLSTIKNSDEILVLENGMLVEKGSHTELLEQKGVYFSSWQLQSL